MSLLEHPEAQALLNDATVTPDTVQGCTHDSTRVTGPFIFPNARGNEPLSEKALEMLMRRLDAKPATVHGFRSAFRDWAGEETNFPRELAEQALAHQVGDPVEQAYRRGDALERRRALMDAWSAFCEPRNSANVVPMARRSRVKE